MADVICPNCGDRYHETTEAYRPGVTTTGNMLRLKKTYIDNGWSSFPEYESTAFGDMDCPGCGGLYSDNGRVRIDVEQWNKEYHAYSEGKEVKPETFNETMQRLFDEYEAEVPKPREWMRQVREEELGLYKNRLKRKQGRPRR